MRSFFIVAICLITHSYALAQWLEIPHRNAFAIDQRSIHEDGCGPIAQLNAYHFASDNWQSLRAKLPQSSDQQFQLITQKYCRRFSKNAYQRRLWEERIGIRPDDLCEAMNAFHQDCGARQVTLCRLFLTPQETHPQLLARVHESMRQSLENGFPPVLLVTRFAKITSNSGGYRWAQTTSHFITVTRIPETLAEKAEHFAFRYIDPWGGRTLDGQIAISQNSFYANDITNRDDKSLRKNATCIALLPHSAVGSHLISEKLPQAVAATHLIIAGKE